MKPRNYKNIQVPYEEQEQEVLAQWLDLHKICWFHVPNERKCSKAHGAKLKRLGVKKGAPDVLIFDIPKLGFIKKTRALPFSEQIADQAFSVIKNKGIAIELKRSKGSKTTPEQLEWKEKLDARGWIALICKGADAAIDALKEMGYGKRSSL